MSVLNKLYDELKTYSNFSENNNAEKFLDIVDKITELGDPCSIGIILSYFEDDTDYGWVFQSASSAIEKYPMRSYIDELIINLPRLMNNGPIWADNFFNRIFNHSRDLKYFKKRFKTAKKEDLLKLFDVMDNESPHHKSLIDGLRKELKDL